MNRYQAIRPAQNPVAQPPIQAIASADHTWSSSKLWSQDLKAGDSTVLIDFMASGAKFLSLLRLWHEKQGNRPMLNRANAPEVDVTATVRPSGPIQHLTVYALDLSPWSLADLKVYWKNFSTEFGSHLHSDTSTLMGTALSHLLNNWPEPTPGLHCIHFKPWACTLWLWFGDVELGVLQFNAKLSASLIETELTPKALRHLNNLKVDSGPSPTAKAVVEHLPSPIPPKVAVIGAGIAGSCTARALCQQGIEVHLIDAAEGPAAGASGNWVGAFHPHITRDDTPLSQLTRLGCEFSVQALESLTQEGLLVKGEDWDMPGHLQTIPADEVERARGTLAQLQFPESVVRWAEPFSKMETPLHGLFFPQGAWVKPSRWVQANLQSCGTRLKVHYSYRVKALGGLGLTDLLHDLKSRLNVEVDAVVVACAQSSFVVSGLDPGQSNSVKGQITRVQKVDGLPHVASGESYAIAPPAEAWVLLGATYERPVGELIPTAQSDALNIERFQAAFPSLTFGKHLDSRCAVRFVWPDRLPVVGPAHGNAGGQNSAGLPPVYLNTAYASRGLTWAALAAHLIACKVSTTVSTAGRQGPIAFKLTDRFLPRKPAK